MEKNFLRAHEAAKEIGVSIHTIRAYVRRGSLVPRRLAGSRFLWFTREDLMNAIVRPVRDPALRLVKK